MRGARTDVGHAVESEKRGWVKDQVHGLGQWLIAGVVTVVVGLAIMGIVQAIGG